MGVAGAGPPGSRTWFCPRQERSMRVRSLVVKLLISAATLSLIGWLSGPLAGGQDERGGEPAVPPRQHQGRPRPGVAWLGHEVDVDARREPGNPGGRRQDAGTQGQ